MKKLLPHQSRKNSTFYVATTFCSDNTLSVEAPPSEFNDLCNTNRWYITCTFFCTIYLQPRLGPVNIHDSYLLWECMFLRLKDTVSYMRRSIYFNSLSLHGTDFTSSPPFHLHLLRSTGVGSTILFVLYISCVTYKRKTNWKGRTFCPFLGVCHILIFSNVFLFCRQTPDIFLSEFLIR